MSVVIGGIYEHYKGNRYEVVGVAKHSETLEKMVVYKALYGEDKLWVRPYDMFVEKIEKNGLLIDRFKCLNNELETIHRISIDLSADVEAFLLENNIDIASEIGRDVKNVKIEFQPNEHDGPNKNVALVILASGATVSAVLFSLATLLRTIFNRPRLITVIKRDTNNNVIGEENVLLQPDESKQSFSLDLEAGTDTISFKINNESDKLKR